MNKDFINWIITAGYFIATLGGVSTTVNAETYLGLFFVLVLAAIGFPQFVKSFKALRGKKEGE